MIPVKPSMRLVRMARLSAPKQAGIPEDFFTEALAAALEEDLDLTGALLRHLLGAPASPQTVAAIRTQEAFTSSRIDLVLELSNGALIAVENKLDAAEGEGQLAKYLGLSEVTHVAFLAPRLHPLEEDVVRHPKFLRPAGGDPHFRWGDLYPLVAAANSPTAAASSARRGLLGLFTYLGYTPPIAMVGDIHDPDPSNRRGSMQRMEALMHESRKLVYDLGYQRDGHWDAQVTTRVWRGHSPSKIWLDGFTEPGLLTARLYYATEDARDQAERAVVGAEAIPAHNALDVYPFPSTRKDPDARYCLKVSVSLHALLLGDGTPLAATGRIREFVGALMTAATIR